MDGTEGCTCRRLAPQAMTNMVSESIKPVSAYVDMTLLTPSRTFTLFLAITLKCPLCNAEHGGCFRPIVSSMQNTPLPPTWTAFAIAKRSSAASSLHATHDDDTADDLPPRQPLLIAYVNRTTGERTCRHPGARYFSGLVDRARNRPSQITGEKADGSALASEQYGCSACGDREAVRAGGATLVAGGAHRSSLRAPSYPVKSCRCCDVFRRIK